MASDLEPSAETAAVAAGQPLPPRLEVFGSGSSDLQAEEDANKQLRASDFGTYLVSALNDSLIKKSKLLNLADGFLSLDQIKSLSFTTWWVEVGKKNLINIEYRLDGQPHEIVIKDTKYFVKELYSSDKRNN